MPRKPNTTKKERYNDPFPTVLRRLIEEKEITQEELKEKLGVSTRQSVTGYIDGSTLPTIDKINALADLFDVSADYLLGRTPEKTSDVNLQAVYNDLGLSEESVNVIRNIKAERLDDGLNFLIEANDFLGLIERTSDLIRACKYAILDNQRFVELEAQAKALQEEHPEMMILTGTERLSHDITEAERKLDRILRFESLFQEIELGDPEIIELLKRKVKEGKLYE